VQAVIVARICDKNGKPIVQTGSSRIEGHRGEDGWFPIESFNFGFLEKSDDKKDPAGGAKGQPGAGGKSPAAPPSPAGGKGEKGKDFSELSLEKQVDTVTCLLMVLAMKERKSKKGVSRDQETKLEADIHIISSVHVDQKAERCTFTNLMIHLEAVNILGWEIRGSGDSRPTETIKLRYDRAAMIYVKTPDGKTVDPLIGPKGWDQTKSVEFDEGEFNWSRSKWEKYLPT
jgi:hypothetical protein